MDLRPEFRSKSEAQGRPLAAGGFHADVNILDELRALAKRHHRFASAVDDLANELPFASDIAMTVANTMIEHLMQTDSTVELCIDASCEDPTHGEHRLPSTLTVELRGNDLAGRTAGEIATQIILPSHKVSPEILEARRDGSSPMEDFTETMTVRQLVDVVAYLRSEAGEEAPQEGR